MFDDNCLRFDPKVASIVPKTLDNFNVKLILELLMKYEEAALRYSKSIELQIGWMGSLWFIAQVLLEIRGYLNRCNLSTELDNLLPRFVPFCTLLQVTSHRIIVHGNNWLIIIT